MTNSETIGLPKPPADLLGSGSTWAEGEILESQREKIDNLVQAVCVRGLQIVLAHIDEVRLDISRRDGIRDENTSYEYYENLHNSAVLNDDSTITPSRLYKTRPVTVSEDPTPSSIISDMTAMQEYSIDMGFGRGFADASSVMTRQELDGSRHDPHVFTDFISDEPLIRDIGLTETVTTTFGDNEMREDVHYAIHSGRHWPGMSLETAPQGSNGQLAVLGLSSVGGANNLCFQGMVEKQYREGETYRQLGPYINEGVIVDGGEADKLRTLLKFNRLLGFYASQAFPDLDLMEVDTKSFSMP